MKNLFADRTMRSFIVISLLSKFGICILTAMYVVFLESHGLNLFQVNMVNFCFYTTLLVFEVPTGALADTFGRRNSMVMACALIGIGMTAYGLSHALAGFIISEILIAMGGALSSGAFVAWLHDQLESEGRAHEQRKIMATSSMLEQIAMLVSASIGAVTFAWQPVAPFVIGGFFMFVCAAYAWRTMHEAPYRRRSARRMWHTLCLAVRFAWRHQAIRTLIWLGLLQSAAFMAPNMQWQPFFLPHLPGKPWLGAVIIVISASLFVGSWIARHLHNARPENLLVLAQAVIGFGILLTPLVAPFPVAFTIFMVHEVARGFFNPVKLSFLNTCIRSRRKRATVLSCEAMSRDLGGMIGLPISGALALHGGIPLTWTISGVVLLFGVFVLRGRLRLK